MKLSKDDYAFLQKFDYNFYTATQANYSAAIGTADIEKMRDVYSRCIGTQHKMNLSCGTCILGLLKKLSVYYYAYKNGKEENSETEGNSNGQTSEKTQNTKRSRKRKE